MGSGPKKADPEDPEDLEDLEDLPDLTDRVHIQTRALPPRHPSPREAGSPTHRELFETRLHPLAAEQREARARGAEEPELSALCFDPVVRVIQRLLDNPRFALQHARLVAAHHPNAAGLEALAARGAFFSDREVQRRLLRNTQSRVGLIHRILATRRLLEIWNVSESRELSDRNRQVAREALGRRYASCSPEERVELVLRSEGRALLALGDRPLDHRAVVLLTERPVTSPLLVRNLAAWRPTPAPVLAHLLKQAVVRGNPGLRALVKRHPHCPPAV
jgi:hypothetical protein